MAIDKPAAPAKSLPSRASLENLRNQARTLQKQHRAGVVDAMARVAVCLPAATAPLKLHDAQHVLAREYGMASWPRLVEHLQPGRSRDRVRRAGGRVWIDGVPRLRWGSNQEPTYIGALEAAFRGSERPLDVTTLLGDSGLAFRVRWATRDNGNAWCGSGPCGEWPEEVEALGASTGYIYVFEPHEPSRPMPAAYIERITENIDQGWPILGFGKRMDMSVIFGYEDEGRRVLLSDYWADEEPLVMATGDIKAIGALLERIAAPAPRPTAFLAGLALAQRRWREGVADPDPINGATYHYGSAGYERWLADLERAPGLTEQQQRNLWFLNSWTFSSLHSTRSEHAARYLRANAKHAPSEARESLEAAARCYDRVRERFGTWDTADPTFGMLKQKPFETWSPDVRARESALLRDVFELEASAFDEIEQALRIASLP